jgi:fatty-acyl-CoA synthase
MNLGAMQDWPLRIMRLMDHAEREHGDREIVASRAHGTTVRTHWTRLAHDARRMAQALERLGLGPADRVATLAMNHDRHLAAWFGVVGMGGVLHTANPRLFDDQLDYIMDHAEDRVLLYDAAFEPLIERLKPGLATVKHYIRFDDEFDDWLGAEDGDYRWHEGDERDPCGLCYTSGTTGNPKGVLYEHRSTVLHAMSIIAPDVFDLAASSVMLPVVPMVHANSWCLPYAAAITGLKLVICSDNKAEHICRMFKEEGVTHSAGVPTVWLNIIDHIEDTGGDLARKKAADFAFADAAPVVAHDQQQRALVPLRVGDSDRRRFQDARAADSGILELDRADPFPAGLDHVLGSVGEPECVVGMDDRDVAGVEPVFGIDAVRVLLEIAPDDGATARLQMPGADPVPRLDLTRIVDHAKLDSEHRAARA